MNWLSRFMLTSIVTLAVGTIAQPAETQETAGGPKVGVIDVPRLVTDSAAGKEVLADLQRISDEKSAELKILGDELKAIEAQISEGRLSLSEAKLSELQRELEDKTIKFRRARDDAQKQLQDIQTRRFTEIEEKVMPIINEVGVSGGYTMIFNKFESGLVFAQESVDITDLILQRFDASEQTEAAPAEDDGS